MIKDKHHNFLNSSSISKMIRQIAILCRNDSATRKLITLYAVMIPKIVSWLCFMP